MTDQELLQAIGQVIETKLEPVRQDICELKEQVGRLEPRMERLETQVERLETRMERLETRVEHLETKMDRLETRVEHLEARVGNLEEQMTGVRVCIDTDLQRTLNLLLEGQQALWDRFVPQEKHELLKGRTEVLELTVKRHSQEIRELKRA